MSTLNLRVSDAMVAQFAALTGDCSSLHVSDAFARRSAYRRPIVHGMLPLSFLALLPPFRVEQLRARPVAMQSRFTAPVYAGDPLTLTTQPSESVGEEDAIEIAFRIEHQLSHAEVTAGSITIAYDRRPDSQRSIDGPSGLLSRPVDLTHMQLEQLESGLEDCLVFRPTHGAVRALAEMLSTGAQELVDADELARRLDVPTFFSVLLFSTSVGVSLPGSSATFLEFSARFHRPIESGREFHLRGRVAHRSKSTRIIKKDLAVVDPEGGSPLLTGKASVLVNKPARSMPSIEELKESAGDFGLNGKTVLITGASRGIGETTAKLFALAGARVIVNYHRGAEDAARVVQEISRAGGEAIAVAADVTDAAAVSALVQAGIDRFGAVDILVNNAARDYRPIPFLNLSWEEAQKDIDVIVKGAFLCCQQVIPRMLAVGGGKIINISTVATENPPPDQVKYVMAKSALVGLTRSLAVEFAAKNIQANLVVPNFVETDFVAHIPDGFRTKIANDTPMRRNALPVEVARAVLFLASSHSSFTSGQKLMVTGGGLPYL